MAQGGDTDRRLNFDGTEYNVVCLNCGKHFTAKRCDATYCSSRCRTYASRGPERKRAAMAELQAMGRRANRIAASYSGSQDMLDQMVLLKQAIDRALQTFEVKWELQQIPE